MSEVWKWVMEHLDMGSVMAELIAAVILAVVSYAFGRIHGRILSHQIDAIPEILKTLATRYECANWIREKPERVAKKDEIFAEMRTYGRSHRIPKKALIRSKQLGRLMLVAASALEQPSREDVDSLGEIPGQDIPAGHSRWRFFEAADYLISRSDVFQDRDRRFLCRWILELSRDDTELLLKAKALADAHGVQ